jgi:hypothetical protein
LIALIALALASLACPALLANATPTPTGDFALPTSTPSDLLLTEGGLTRRDPAPHAALLSAPNWDVQIIEWMRGDEARRAIQQANQFNDPAPEGMEYVLVRLKVTSTYADAGEHTISGADFKVTGDRLIRYFKAPAVYISLEN